jgi:hypothetical protein
MLLGLKENQGHMYAAVQDWFADEARHPSGETLVYKEISKGQGRRVSYQIQTTQVLYDYFRTELDWPWLGQAFQIRRRSVSTLTGEVQEKTHFGVTDLTSSQASPQQVLGYWRGHWHVENKEHWVLDVVLAKTIRRPASLSILRSSALVLLRLFHPQGITLARTELSANIGLACSLFGVPLE